MNTSGRDNTFSYCNIRHLCWLAALFGIICWWCLPVSANAGSRDESARLLAAANPSGEKLAAGNFITFGRYPQTIRGEIKPIQWVVLENNGGTVLMLSRFALDCKKFHNEFKSVSWRDSDLRKWLNNDFYNFAFNDAEKRKIVDSSILTPGNPDYGTRGCGVTIDKVFCLSIREVWNYFGKPMPGDSTKGTVGANSWQHRERSAVATTYAVRQGVAVWGNDSTYRDMTNELWHDKCWYWLRSPGYDDNFAACVNDVGAVYGSGTIVDVDDFAVRPAIRVKLQ
ncbi:MAG: DUF6273 domain-containing protein [bacterium]|nr:DUF6273 domain-containing protein [bacterium]